MEIRHATEQDFPRMMEIYAYARDFMAKTGNPNQWGPTHWPPEELIHDDIRSGHSYVCEDNGRVVGTFYFNAGTSIDPTYAVIDGSWSKDAPYGVLHRVASDGTQKGIVSACVAFASQRYDYLRIDTHADNLPMQKALAREGFVYRGIITVYDGTPRMAYDK